MADIDGSYEVTVKTPLGDQTMTLTVKGDGNAFTGTASGAMGASDITGELNGNTLLWKQQVSVPMPMTLDMEVAIDGDQVAGSVGAGAFGSFPLTGRRVG